MKRQLKELVLAVLMLAALVLIMIFSSSCLTVDVRDHHIQNQPIEYPVDVDSLSERKDGKIQVDEQLKLENEKERIFKQHNQKTDGYSFGDECPERVCTPIDM